MARASATLWRRQVKILANLPDKNFIDLAVPSSQGDCQRFTDDVFAEEGLLGKSPVGLENPLNRLGQVLSRLVQRVALGVCAW